MAISTTFNRIKREIGIKKCVIIDGNVGDVEKSAYQKASYYTPVPGGVGPMTIAELLYQTKCAIESLKSNSNW